MKAAYSFLWLIISSAFVIGCVLVFVLSFYLSAGHIVGTGGHAYRVWDAIAVLFQQAYALSFSPDRLTPDEHALLDWYGGSLISFVSVTAVVISAIAVRRKLAELDGLLLYEKFDTAWCWRTLQSFHPFNNNARAHGFLDRKIERRYREFRVMKMAHFYRASDQLLIVSGNFSWLFDTAWAPQMRKIITDRLPDKVCLVSNRCPKEVADFWKRFPEMRLAKHIFEAITFTDETNDYNASVVRMGNEKLYMYLYKERHKPTRRSYVCVFRGDREAEALVKLVEDEFLRLHSAALTDERREKEKRAVLIDPEYFG